MLGLLGGVRGYSGYELPLVYFVEDVVGGCGEEQVPSIRQRLRALHNFIAPGECILFIGLSQVEHADHAVKGTTVEVGRDVSVESDRGDLLFEAVLELRPLLHFPQIPKNYIIVTPCGYDVLCLINASEMAGYF